MDTTEKNLQGLGGWLTLVGLGVVMAPLRVLGVLVPLYQDVFVPEVWSKLDDSIKDLIYIEAGGNSLMFVFSLYLIYLFFAKKKWFPAFFIGLALFTLVFIVVDSWSYTFFVDPKEPIFDPDTLKEVVRSLIVCLIWVPYMLVSKRVKQTFIE